jgi:hypothetical protein
MTAKGLRRPEIVRRAFQMRKLWNEPAPDSSGSSSWSPKANANEDYEHARIHRKGCSPDCRGIPIDERRCEMNTTTMPRFTAEFRSLEPMDNFTQLHLIPIMCLMSR